MSANDYEMVWYSTFASGGRREHASKHGSLASARAAGIRAGKNKGYEGFTIRKYDPQAGTYKSLSWR